MRLYEFAIHSELMYLYEDVSKDASIKHIVDILTTQLPQLYTTLSRMAENFMDSHGELGNKFKFISGGQRSRWFHQIFFPYMKPALYNLSKYVNKNDANELRELAGVKGMAPIESNLLDLLYEIGKHINNKSLIDAAQSAKSARERYYAVYDRLEKENEEDDSGYQDPPVPKEQNPISKQNATVDSIINDALSRINKRDAGEIRNILAKSANKLATLQQELKNRNIKI